MGTATAERHERAPAKAFPGLPQGVEARVAYFKARIAAREAADPQHIFKQLFAWADPTSVPYSARVVEGRAIGLADYHERMRRCFVLRAWCAWKIGRHNDTKVALFKAGTHKRLARAARMDGR